MGHKAPAVVAGFGVVIAVLSVAAARRRVRRADARVRTTVTELTERTEELLSELEGALEEARADARRGRALGDIAGSIDLDDVFARTLEAAASLPGVDAVLITVPDGDDPPLVRALGMTADETERRTVPGPPDGRSARAVAVSYHYGEDERRTGSSFIYGGISVPVGVSARENGSLAIFTRSPAHQFPERHVRELEELASRAGPALANALRFRNAREQADLDPLTGLLNRRVFHETLEQELTRARRYGRRLTLVLLDVDDFKAVNERLGHLAADGVLGEIGSRVRAAVRGTDVACRVGGDELGIVMPESTLDDGVRLSERLQRAVSSPALVQVGPLSVSAGVAELVPDGDARTLFELADQALARAKADGKGRVALASAAH
jgi:diguanylate cyclase (GGDEF)-like protein